MCNVKDCAVEGNHFDKYVVHLSARGKVYPADIGGMHKLIEDYERDKAEFRHIADGFVERIRDLVDQTTRKG